MFNVFLEKLIEIIKNGTFNEQTANIEKYIHTIQLKDFVVLVKEIGTIPESITASSSMEKLYSKSSDIILSKCF